MPGIATKEDAAEKLRAIARSFGPEAARQKETLLEALARAPRLGGAKRLRLLRETLRFVRAVPDDSRVLARAREAIHALPPPEDVVFRFSYETASRLVRLFPGRLDLAWDALEDESALLDTLFLLVAPPEAQGLEDLNVSLRDWFAACRGAGTDLELLVRLLQGAGLGEAVRSHLYEMCALTVRYRGPEPCAVELPGGKVRFQKEAIERERFRIEPVIRRPLGRLERGGRSALDVAMQALAFRCLEIYPLLHANPEDVLLADCGRGVRIVLAGVLPGFRSALEALHFFLVLKNGVPVAYGPAAVCAGCCEMGINLFPEYRGMEVRFVYAQLMRLLHQLLGVEYFHLTRYAMGEDNEEALRSGAFWFYRRLGFVPGNPEVERIARAEEAKMAAEPGYRSDLRTLRRLSRTEAYLDLSGGRCRMLPLGSIGIAVSRMVESRFGGDRARARRETARQVRSALGIRGPAEALDLLAPIVATLPDVERWSREERSGLAAFVREKAGRSERKAALLLKTQQRFLDALRNLTSAGGSLARSR